VQVSHRGGFYHGGATLFTPDTIVPCPYDSA
jgi:hypothetical protein